MKFRKATYFLLAAAAASGPAKAQPEQKVWLLCSAWLDPRHYAAPPVLVPQSEVPKLSRKFSDMSGTYQKDRCAVYKALEDIPWDSKPGASWQSVTSDDTIIEVVAYPNLSKDWAGTPGDEVTREAASKKTNSAATDAGRAEGGTLTVDAPKYVEVPGPNGTMRLSPAVAARNQAAAEEYSRKMQEHSDAVARAEAAHAESLARQAESVAKAAAAQQEFEQRVAVAKREYEQRLADHAVKLAATKTAASSGGTSTTTGEKDRIFKATSMAFDTKDAAMAYLSGLRLPPFFEVQCNQQKFFTPPKWSCTGHYRQTVTRSSTSKQ